MTNVHPETGLIIQQCAGRADHATHDWNIYAPNGPSIRRVNPSGNRTCEGYSPTLPKVVDQPQPMLRNYHRCPRQGCQVQVPNSLFACREDWFKLSATTRRLVFKTAGLPSIAPERRVAFEQARADWAPRNCV